jgi:RNA polymerase sigma-70 factor (ECF subfamily)
MFAIAQAYFASQADVEDAVQEAFVKAFRALDQLEDDRRFVGWLARITVNCCLAILRSRTDKVSLADFASTVMLRHRLGRVDLTPASLSSQGEEADQLRAAIGRLPETQRLAVLLHYGADMTYKEVAACLDVPYTTVVGRLYTARRALREMLGNLSTAH